MSDLICRNTMMRCNTPGMCSPHGGCRETEPVSSVWLEQLRSEFRAAVRERDALKAECEGLRKDAELIGVSRAKIAGELSRLRAKHGDFTSGPGEDDAPYLFACSLDRKVCTVDFNGTPHHYIEMSEQFVACACGDEYRIDSYDAGFMAANDGVCENCDAANGGVEPVLDTPLSKESAL